MIINSNSKVSIELTPSEAIELMHKLAQMVQGAYTNNATNTAWSSIPASYKKEGEDHHRFGSVHIRVEV